MNEITKRKLLRASCHASALVSWSVVVIGLPIAVLLLTEDQLAKDSAKEALNFQLNMILLTFTGGILWHTFIGIPLAVILFAYVGIVSLVCPLLAIISVCSSPEKAYRYPLTFRFVNKEEPPKITAAL